MAFDIRSLDVESISRAQKQNVRLDTKYNDGVVFDEENPLKGVTKKQRNRNVGVGDILDIGSGTRCVSCGMLHFLWVENCGSCRKPMEYNLGRRE
jgi:hypothetical protein